MGFFDHHFDKFIKGDAFFDGDNIRMRDHNIFGGHIAQCDDVFKKRPFMKRNRLVVFPATFGKFFKRIRKRCFAVTDLAPQSQCLRNIAPQ